MYKRQVQAKSAAASPSGQSTSAYQCRDSRCVCSLANDAVLAKTKSSHNSTLFLSKKSEEASYSGTPDLSLIHICAEIAVPQIEDSDPSTPLDDSLAQMNQALSGYADSIIAQYEADLAAGGDLGHEYVYSDFQVLRDSNRLLSVCIRTDIVMASTNSFVKIYHLDKTAGQLIELSDLFRPDSSYVCLLYTSRCV